jgi:hypothetical protein
LEDYADVAHLSTHQAILGPGNDNSKCLPLL